MILNTSKTAWDIFVANAKKGFISKAQWESPKQKRVYTIFDIEPDRVIVTRERGNNSRIIPLDLFSLLSTINKKGKLKRAEYTKASVAQLSTMVNFHPNLCWSKDFDWVEIATVQLKDGLEYEHFGTPPNDNLDELQTFARKVRKGQPLFRKSLLLLYKGRCCVTNTDIGELLEACHIQAHSKSGINELSNGLILRSDIHLLFDYGLLFIEPKTMRVHLHPKLLDTPYKEYHLQKINSRKDGTNPAEEFLLSRWQRKTF